MSDADGSTTGPGSGPSALRATAGRASRWGIGGGIGGFLVVFGCCGGVPLGFALAAAAGVGLLTGLGAILVAVVSVGAAALIGRRRSGRCRSPAPSDHGAATHRPDRPPSSISAMTEGADS